jgi:hypothetical protein
MTGLASWLRRLGVLGVMLALFALTPAIAHQHEPHTPQQQQTEPAPAEAAPGDEPVMTMPWPTAPVMTEHDERPTTFSGRLLRWLGGWHPAAVHFPIALLLTVAFLELMALIAPQADLHARATSSCWRLRSSARSLRRRLAGSMQALPAADDESL